MVVGVATTVGADARRRRRRVRVGGFVDIQRVLARSSAGVAAREQLEKEKAAMQRQVDSQRGDIEKLRDELEKKGQEVVGTTVAAFGHLHILVNNAGISGSFDPEHP